VSDVIRKRRTALGMSQAALAAAIGVDARQIRRYEAGESQPTLPIAVALAEALGLSLNELAGKEPAHRVDLTGDWWASWQTFKGGEEIITAQQVRFAQQDELIQLHTLTRGIEVDEGGYLWRGELRLWDNEILMGWYAANDGAVRSKGTMYFVLHAHGINMSGRWVGLSYDGAVMTGWGAIAKIEQEARSLIAELKERQGMPA
jgi:transcriptional regulator with XRE-family HTH domain